MGIPIGSFYKSKYPGQQIENALDTFKNMASEYDPTQTYSVGDVVLYNNILYECTATTTGTFDPTKWTQITLVEIGAKAGEAAGREAAEEVVENTVQTVPQTFTDTQKQQARDNIDVLSSSEVYALFPKKTVSNDPDNAVFDAVLNEAIKAPVLSTVIKGKTVAVNQLVQNGNFADGTTGWTAVNQATLTVSNKIATLTATVQDGLAQSTTFNGISGHLYYVVAMMKLSSETNLVQINMTGMSNWFIQPQLTTNWQAVEGIKTAPSSGNKTVNIRDRRSSGWDSVQFTNVNAIDLTTSPVASRLTEIGTDVAKLKQVWLEEVGTPLPQYIPYDAGSLVNVNGEYRMRGRNLWDEEWEVGGINNDTGQNDLSSSTWRGKNYIPIEPNKPYYFYYAYGNNASLRYYWYDAEKNFISSSTVANQMLTAPSNAKYLRIRSTTAGGATYTYDVTINESDPSINGQYIPSYSGGTIDCSAEPLNGFDDTVCDVKDFATGQRTTKCGMVDLGSLTWTYNTTDASNPLFYARITGRKTSEFNAIVPRYTKGANIYSSADKTWTWAPYHYNDEINIFDSAYTDSATFKTAMNGVYLCYELATPVVSTETPQPLETQYGYNVLEPVSGGVQSAEVTAKYTESIEGYISERLNA